MTESASLSPLFNLLHELAERLQATGNHLNLAQRIIGRDGSNYVPLVETLGRAVDEMMRTERAFHCLRDHLIQEQRYESDATIALVGLGAVVPATGQETPEQSRR